MVRELKAGSAELRSLMDFLTGVVPFRFLKDSCHALLVEAGLCSSYKRGEVLLEGGSGEPEGVFLLLSGSVESIDDKKKPELRVNVIDSGSYFGEGRLILGSPRQYRVQALEDCLCFIIPAPTFLGILSQNRGFALSLGRILREGQGIFGAFERFTSQVIRDLALGHIELRRLLPLYQALEPALHSGANDESVLDTAALLYAVRRLPENVTSSLVYLLTDELPFMYADVDKLFTFIHSESRHRFIYEMLPGKDMVLVRNGLSDLMDFVTCLCVLAVETRKIRKRMNHPDIIRGLSDYLRADSAQVGPEGPFLESLPFSAQEREELCRIWPGKTAQRLRELAFTRQAYSLDIRKQTDNYNARLAELWTQEVGLAAEAYLGLRPPELPDSYEVHIISSNTHSVSNCLNPFFTRNAKEILGWAAQEGLKTPGWLNPFDELYSLTRGFLRAKPERIEGLRESERERGILRMKETVTTGIQVQLIDTTKLDPAFIDPGVSLSGRGKQALIVNIDYAFGEQAQDILRSLILLFGANIRSVNVLGKAGALLGSRGDVLVPDSFIEQKTDALEILPEACPDCMQTLAARLGPGKLHRGPLLTVGGTLLQNRSMLNFYRSIWGCVGLEMEGIYYHWAMAEARQLGLLREGAETRFLYYVSDLPLLPGAGLSERLSPQEGIPPLYAITREVLTRILS